MKRIAVFFLLASALFINLNILAAKAADGRPPAIEEGWNLFSVPCDVELSALQAKLGDAALEVYEWSGTDYTAAGSLKRGYGYIIKSGREVKDTGLCDGKTDTQPVIIKLSEGWNLMGNPNASNLSFSEAFKENASSIADLMFKIEDGRYKPILKTDSIDAWKAVWVYSFKDIELPFGITCGSYIVEVVDPQSWTIELGKTIKFKASCIKNGFVEDVTKKGIWLVSDSNVLKPGTEKGEFTAIKFSESVVSIAYSLGPKPSNTLYITITKGSLLDIKLTLDKTELKVGEATPAVAIGTYSSGATGTLKLCEHSYNKTNRCFDTDNNYYSATYNIIGKIYYKGYYSPNGHSSSYSKDLFAFYAFNEGEKCESVRSINNNIEGKSIVSNQVCVKVTMPDAPDKIIASVSPNRLMFPGGNAKVVATGVYGFAYVDITKYVEWDYDKDAGALDDKYVFSPSKAGTVTFTAKMGSITSIKAELSVIQKKLVSISSNAYSLNYFSCDYSITGRYLFVGNSAKPTITGYYNDYSSQNVTDEIEKWEVEDENILKAEGNTITALSAGRTRVRASIGEIWGNWLEIYVVDENTSYLTLADLSKFSPVKVGNSIKLSGAVMHVSGFKKAQSGSYYEGYSCKDITADIKYSVKDTNIAEITGSTFKGKSYGTAIITAKYKDITSNSSSIEVWNPVNMKYCDPENLNEAMWSRSGYIVALSTDCDSYKNDTPVGINLSMQMDMYDSWTPNYCAELYIYNSAQELVKTLKGGHCGNESLFRTVAGYKPFYEYNTKWDRRDETGKPVPLGEYYAVSRFAVQVDPVVKVKFAIK
ncbi:MAG: hypothetical protein WCX65_06265 [bacterium]